MVSSTTYGESPPLRILPERESDRTTDIAVDRLFWNIMSGKYVLLGVWLAGWLRSFIQYGAVVMAAGISPLSDILAKPCRQTDRQEGGPLGQIWTPVHLKKYLLISWVELGFTKTLESAEAVKKMSGKKGILQRNGNSEMANKFVLWRNVLLVSFLTIMVLFVSVMAEKMCNRMPLLFEMGDTACYEDNCSLHIVESIPDNLTFPPEEISHMSTYEGLLQLIEEATESIDIASFYWSMLGEDVPFSDSSAWQGENLFKALLEAGQKRNIKIRIVINKPTKYLHDYDTKYLEKYANAEVRYLDFKKLMGGGILHTKVWIVDRCHFYVGSANLDWRSFTQVKELGALVQKCCCITADLMKLFSVYWVLGKADSVPSKWESSYSTEINGLTPMTISVKNMLYDVYFSSSPKPFCPKGRTVDIDAILDVINSAEKFIYIAVMDYYPTITYVFPKVYWPLIDDALRNASFARNVKVRFMASKWYHTRKDMFYYLNSLNVVENLAIEIKVFEVPFYTEEQRKIPFSRVNHNKYMVTEKIAYIGTSNWSGEYFVYTGGVGFIIQPKEKGKGGEEQDVRQQLEKTFLRDWNSEFAKPLSDILKNN